MDLTDKNKISIFIFGAIIIALLVGGFFLITKPDEKTSEKKEESTYEEIKLNKDEDFIYFTNIDQISKELKIIYQDVNININSEDAKTIQKQINATLPDLKNTIKRISEMEGIDASSILYEHDDLYSAEVRDFDYYRYNQYLTLQVLEYTYDCYGYGSENSITSYVFDLTTGKLLTQTDLLNKYNQTVSSIKEKLIAQVDIIKQEVATSNPGLDLIDTAATINKINNQEYSLYINKTGQLTANIVVITNEINYNEDIVIN